MDECKVSPKHRLQVDFPQPKAVWMKYPLPPSNIVSKGRRLHVSEARLHIGIRYIYLKPGIRKSYRSNAEVSGSNNPL